MTANPHSCVGSLGVTLGETLEVFRLFVEKLLPPFGRDPSKWGVASRSGSGYYRGTPSSLWGRRSNGNFKCIDQTTKSFNPSSLWGRRSNGNQEIFPFLVKRGEKPSSLWGRRSNGNRTLAAFAAVTSPPSSLWGRRSNGNLQLAP